MSVRSVFLGDICVHQPFPTAGSMEVGFLKSADLVLANLEGAIGATSAEANSKAMGVWNSVDVLPVLKALHVRAVWLANNHLYDLSQPVHHTTQALAAQGIASFGAGANLEAAGRPFTFTQADTTIKAFAFGWDVIGCRLARTDREGVNPLVPEYLLQTIRAFRKNDQRSFVLFIMHWNYELELYPQPAQRQLAHDLIAEGVDAIVGLHPHVAQGAELVGGKPIIYSLGNWLFPPRELGQFHLRFPAITHRELAVTVQNNGRNIEDVRFHWHHYDLESNQISLEATEDWQGPILKSLTPFAGMPHAEYIQWFRQHRSRRKGLPVYANYRDNLGNAFKDRFVKARHSAINALVALNLKRGLG